MYAGGGENKKPSVVRLAEKLETFSRHVIDFTSGHKEDNLF